MLLAFQELGYKSVSSLSNVPMQMEDAVISVPARNKEWKQKNNLWAYNHLTSLKVD